MNQFKNVLSEDQVDPEIGQVNGLKTNHNDFFQSLEHKLISKSSKLSNFMGATHLMKLSKAQSQHLDEDSDNQSCKNFRKFAESSSVSPVKNKFELLKKTIFDAKQKTKPIPNKKVTMSDAMTKLMQLKSQIIDKKNVYRSSTSSSQNQRKLAYDYDFTIHSIHQSILSNGPGPKLEQLEQNFEEPETQEQPQPHELHNAKEIYKAAFEQKKKLTETISTTTSLKYPKINLTQIARKFENKVSLKDFQIVKPLGEGKFGTVFLARHIKLNFICALKKMPKVFQDESIVEQLIRQIKIQSFLDHPNICQLYSYFLENDFIYLVLELCNSGNVYQVLKKQGRFPQEKVRSVIRQVCHAMEYLHEHDIIHRDLKPENIIFHENVIKICDFGWSVYAPLSRGTLCGTPIYASPQLVQRKQYDSKIDIWNIGVLTYELLYGRVPFEIRCEEDLQKVVEQQIYFPKSVEASDSVKDFIRQCLNKNPQYRLSIVKLMDHDFIYQKDGGKNQRQITSYRN